MPTLKKKVKMTVYRTSFWTGKKVEICTVTKSGQRIRFKNYDAARSYAAQHGYSGITIQFKDFDFN